MSIILEIQDIKTQDTYSIRHRVLRPERPISECHFSGDNDDGTFHLGIFQNSKLIGVASFMKNSNPFFESLTQFQLRGMAILPEFKIQGHGSLLLKEGEKIIDLKHKDAMLWFNARVTAVDFYKKHGYQIFGKTFEVPGVCEHIVMYRVIDNWLK